MAGKIFVQLVFIIEFIILIRELEGLLVLKGKYADLC